MSENCVAASLFYGADGQYQYCLKQLGYNGESDFIKTANGPLGAACLGTFFACEYE